MLKVEVRFYDDHNPNPTMKVSELVSQALGVKTRDQYGKSVESSECEKVVGFTTLAVDAESLVLTTAAMMCVVLDVDFVHDGESFAFGKDRANAQTN